MVIIWFLLAPLQPCRVGNLFCPPNYEIFGFPNGGQKNCPPYKLKLNNNPFPVIERENRHNPFAEAL